MRYFPLRPFWVCALTFVMAMLSINTQASDQPVLISDAWVRAMPPTVKSSAAYMVIENQTSEDVIIQKVQSAAAMMVELHEHVMKEGMMSMNEVSSVVIPAKGAFRFKPGGHHIMLMGLTDPLIENNKITLRLITSSGQAIDVDAVILKDGSSMMKGDSHSHH